MGKRGKPKTHERLNITLPKSLILEMREYKRKHKVPISQQLAFARKHFKFNIKPLKESL